MKIALCVLPVYPDVDVALREMKKYVQEAIDNHCELIVFPEACLSGLDIRGEFDRDVNLCIGLDSAVMNELQQQAKNNQISICFGFLEYCSDGIYDSSVILDTEGKICFHYRRISNGWIIPGFSTSIYRTGNALKKTESPWGTVSVPICGDLFEDGFSERVESLDLDLCIHIMARSFEIQDDVQIEWDALELPYYIEQWRRVGKYTVCVNSIATNLSKGLDVECGGAWAVNREGQILAQKPLLQEGLLIVDIPL